MGDVAVVRSAMDAFIRGEIEVALRYASPRIVTRRVAPLPDARVYRGHDGVLQAYADWTAVFKDFEMEVVRCDDLGGRIALEVVQRATGRASGVDVLGRFWLLYEVEDGLITRFDIYATREQALRRTRALNSMSDSRTSRPKSRSLSSSSQRSNALFRTETPASAARRAAGSSTPRRRKTSVMSEASLANLMTSRSRRAGLAAIDGLALLDEVTPLLEQIAGCLQGGARWRRWGPPKDGHRQGR